MRVYDHIIEIGIIGLLIYTPLAFGGVTEGSIALWEFVSGALLLLWLFKALVIRKNDPAARIVPLYPSRSPVITSLFVISLVAFLLLIFLQSRALPEFFTRVISPASRALYEEGASATQSPLANRLPLSISRQATTSDLHRFLAYGSIFFLTVMTIRTRKQVNRIVQIILAVGCVEAALGFFQFVSGSSLVDWMPAKGTLSHGTFVNKNHFAGYLEMVIPLSFGIFLTRFKKSGSSRSKPSLDHIRETYPKAFLLLLMIFFMIAALLLSGSRGGIISFSFGMLVLLLLAYNRRLLRKWVTIVFIFVPLSIGITFSINPDLVQKRLPTLGALEADSSFQVRWELWRSALYIFQNYPLTGSGSGTFKHLNPRYRTFRTKLFYFHYAENDYVQLLAETGILGVSLIAVLTVTFFYHLFFLWKRRRSRWTTALAAGGISALCSILIHSWGDFNLHIPSNAFLFTVIAALSYVIVNIPGAEDSRTQREQGRQNALLYVKKMGGKVKRALGTWVLLFSFVLTGAYLISIAKSYYAFIRYQEGRDSISAIDDLSAIDLHQADAITHAIKTAMHYDRSHAEYPYDLGRFLFQMGQDAANVEKKTERFREAEGYLKQAIMLDPANAWYYYELGRLTHLRGDCVEQDQSKEDCSTARYFLAALKNAPKEMFLRQAVGRWLYYYDRDMGHQFIRQLIASDRPHIFQASDLSQEFSKFLYEIHLDYESDREVLAARTSVPEPQKRCHINILDQSSDGNVIELGNDDGSAEWKTRLLSEADRVKKVICLPENLDQYHYAALKIFMNNGDRPTFRTYISIDKQLIKSYENSIARRARWYEIPFDPAILQGKSSINVYIRVSGTSASGNYLHIWGDQDTQASDSLLNYDSTDDLSTNDGIQLGEYLIRLVLRVQE